MSAPLHDADKPRVEETTEAEALNEIEVTEEMIRAGVRAYLSRDSRFMSDEDIVDFIYRAMH